MIDEICKRERCTGCSACAQVCPRGCIAMQPDAEGFLRPVICGERCVSCGLCQKTCPVNHPVDDDGQKPAAFATRHKDEETRRLSSSGGVFSALAKQVLSRGGAVIGAGFDEAHMVIHKVCTDESGLDELRRSKYVQSDIHGTFKEARKLLQNGKPVLFCGTPCQVGGIKAFMSKDEPGLYTVDFICHGVPSPAVWKKYLAFREQQVGAAAEQVSFRDKRTGWQNYSLCIGFKNHARYCNTVRQDMYLRSFIMNMILRPSCSQCAFKQIHRQSDLTIADFWSIDQLDTTWNDDSGVSLVMVHTPKGQKLLSDAAAELETRTVPFDAAVASNPSMTHSVQKNILRDRFMRDLDRLPFDQLHEKYCGTGIAAKIRRKVITYLNRSR